MYYNILSLVEKETKIRLTSDGFSGFLGGFTQYNPLGFFGIFV